MASNRWYTNATNTIIDFTVADAADVENKCDDIADAFDALEIEFDALDSDTSVSIGKVVRHETDALDALTETGPNRANKVIGFDGVGAIELKTIAATGAYVDTVTVVSAAATAVSNKWFLLDPTGTFTLKLPASPTTGNWVGVIASEDAESNWVTVNGNGKNIVGDANLVVDCNNAQFRLVYDGSEWKI